MNSAALDSRLRAEADLELARRSVSGAMAHFLLVLMVAFFTPFYRQEPAALWTAGVGLAVIGAVRLLVARQFPKSYSDNPRMWRWTFRGGAYAAAACWSAFCVFTLYRFEGQTVGWFVLLLTTGLAAGASVSLAPVRSLALSYIAVTLGPILVVELVKNTLVDSAISIAVVLFLVYLGIQSSQQHHTYWNSITTTIRLQLASAEIQERTTRLNALVEGSPLAIVVTDPEGRVQLCNTKFSTIFQFQRDEIAGLKLDELIAPQPLTEGAPGLTRMVLRSGAAHLTAQRRRKDGTLVDVEIHGVPLKLANSLIGIYAIYQDISSRKLAEAELNEAHEELRRRVGELQQRTAEITHLAELGNWLQACLTIDEAYRAIRNTTELLFPGSSGALGIVSNSRNVTDLVATWGSAVPEERVFPPEHCWALRRGKLQHMHPSSAGTLACSHLSASEAAAESVCVPLAAQGESLGVFYLRPGNAPEDGQPYFNSDRMRIVVTLAEQAGLALANLRLRDKLHNQSVRDPLTGLFNRRYMEESLDRELRRAERRQATLGVVMLDLDHFKRFNDLYGHAAGDALLRAFGEFLSGQVRGGDIVCRFGGEEFTVILPEADLAAVQQRMEQVRVEMHRLAKDHGAVTFSGGIAIYPTHGRTMAAILKVADDALYHAKRQGRNQIATPERVSQDAD